ncbi:MAG: hypothetical protein VX737_05235 [Pseudomonadota bacterium]|nr:hypothetical protein [Pseudomonadota bacterium]
MNRKNTHQLWTLITVLIPVFAMGKIQTENISATLTTGAFYTDKSAEVGVVMPWRLKVEYDHKINDKSSINIRTNSQTGITKGPYIDGFNTKPENFKIEVIKYTSDINESLKTRLGLGKIKANILKSGGSATPLPFSQAMAKLPLNSSDFAWSIQKSADSFNGNYTLGTAISNTNTSTKPDDRTYSLFLEAFKKTTDGNLWAQYSQNNLVEIIDSNHYASFGGKQEKGNNVTNASIYIGTQKGFLGFDCGYQRTNIKKLKDSTLGIGYGHSKHEQKTLEISIKKKAVHHFDITTSWYLKAPTEKKQFNAFGIKLDYKL